MAKPPEEPREPSAEDLLRDTPLTDLSADDAARVEGDNEGLDPFHPILSLEEQRKAREVARAAVLEEKRSQAFNAMVAQEREKLLGREGLRTGDAVRDQEVTLTLDLAEHSDRIVLNGTTYLHGHTYPKLPRHVADTLREIQSRGHNHQNEIDGKGLAERFRRPHNTVVDTRPGAGGRISGAPQYQDGQVLR